MVMNEVYTGAGLTATMIPEIDFELSELVGTTAGSIKGISTTNSQKTLTWTVSNTKRLVPDIYKGCVAKLTGYNSSGTALNKVYNLLIKSNTENTIVFNEALSTTASDVWACTILAFGSPVLAPSDTAITGSGVTAITVTNDGAGIPYAANQSLSISGGGGSGAAASYTLTKDKHQITTTAESGTNYDGKWIKIEVAAATTIKYVFWFDIDNAGASVPSHGVSGPTNVEINTIDSSDAAGTVATKIATVMNAQTGLTATASGNKITVESTSGGAVGAVTQASSPPLTVVQLVEGGEIDAVSISAAGSGYSSASVANITSGSTNATFTATVGTTTAPNLLADNWLGLVNTITPPTVEAEMKQMNMALGGTRNFNYQYKGAETPGSASLDVSASHGMWLYYALGNISYATSGAVSSNDLSSGLINDAAYGKDSGSNIYRVKNGSILPPVPAGTTLADYHEITGPLTYTFTESNSGDLPSFALEVTAEKGNVNYATQDTTDDKRKHYSKIYTGLQVNSLTMTFEEGQDVKMSVDAMCRKVHDAASNYIPKAGLTDNLNLFNRKALPNGTLTQDDTKPYMFSDGSIKAFGQSFARIKSGTLTVNNGLTAQRFVGNYDRTIVSAMTAGQRTYEVQLTMLITDNTMWDELRKQNETGSSIGDIELEFEKDDNTNDKIVIKLRDYLTTAVEVPFPDDKAALEVSMTLQARTLASCTYTGKWIIQG
tara:strand:+ start:108 stop:2261 length:2154 start_codon:yes stop_codon:yes gene_type:complete